MPDPRTPGAVFSMGEADLWDDVYCSIDDGRWLAAAYGTLGMYEATWQALCTAMEVGDSHTASAHVGRLNALIRHTEEHDHA